MYISDEKLLFDQDNNFYFLITSGKKKGLSCFNFSPE